MNFTDSPFEKMMKQIPRPGKRSDNPCEGCIVRNYCGGKPGRCKKGFRTLIVKNEKSSGQPGPKSQ